jgi:2-iminobutanoate/2-iminopropanoate deaminase
MRTIRTDSAPAPVAGAPYSQAVAAGGLLFVSGQVPVDPATGVLVEGDVTPQTERVLRNIAAILDAAGAGMHHVVKCTVFLTDLTDFPAMNAVYSGAFGERPPARSTLGVAALPLGARVEIEATAVLPGG